MKVLLIHNFYQSSSPSGEDVVFKNEVELLRRNNIDVVTYTKHNDEIMGYGLWDKAFLPFRNIWSLKTYKELKKLIKKEKPDIAHFHNIWYLISPSAYYACKEMGVPIIQSLHNQRIFCPKATIYRNGQVCTQCANRIVPLPALRYRCFKNSLYKTAGITLTISIHNVMSTWKKFIDIYIVFTNFYLKRFVEWGLPSEKIVVKPHFVYPDPGYSSNLKGRYALFIGRLSLEKGIRTLIAAWKNLSSVPLVIVGSGVLQRDVYQFAAHYPNVKLLSNISRQELFKIIQRARFLIWPSEGWYENFGLVAIESFACGKPVIASWLGAMAELVEDGKTGLLFEPGNPKDLASKIKWMLEHEDECIQMGKNARKVFEEKYTAEKNFEILMHIYQKVLNTV